MKGIEFELVKSFPHCTCNRIVNSFKKNAKNQSIISFCKCCQLLVTEYVFNDMFSPCLTIFHKLSQSKSDATFSSKMESIQRLLSSHFKTVPPEDMVTVIGVLGVEVVGDGGHEGCGNRISY